MGHINLSIPDRIGVIIENPVYLDSFRLHARETLQQIGHLPDTPLWQYLHWRRALAPARFDRFHPEFRRLFHDEGRHHPVAPIVPVVPVTVPIVVIPPTSPPTPTMGTGGVPEPSTGFLLGLAIVLWAIFIAGRRR